MTQRPCDRAGCSPFVIFGRCIRRGTRKWGNWLISGKYRLYRLGCRSIYYIGTIRNPRNYAKSIQIGSSMDKFRKVFD